MNALLENKPRSLPRLRTMFLPNFHFCAQKKKVQLSLRNCILTSIFTLSLPEKKVFVMGKSFWKRAELAEVWQSRLVGAAGVKLGQKANVH